MDTRTGELGSLKYFKEKLEKEEFETFIKPININNLSEQVRKPLLKTGHAQITRNSRCPCGSGKRFKKCCMKKQ